MLSNPAANWLEMRLSHESKIYLQVIAAGIIGDTVSLVLLWKGNFSDAVRWTVAAALLVWTLTLAAAVRNAVRRPLQTLANMHAALREGDFSFRARGACRDDGLGELLCEVNLLSEALRAERWGSFEAPALLRKVMAEIEIAIFAFDDHQRLRLVNRAGERLMARTAERLIGLTAVELGIKSVLDGEASQTVEHSFPAASGRWGIRRSIFRQGGVPHDLVVIADLSRALREEERQAWQRLVRVLTHELNNSLAPIKSISQSLFDLFRRSPRPTDFEQDLQHGLQVIASRSEALSRFMRDYSRLARLPQPRLQKVELTSLVQRVIALEDRLKVRLNPGPEIMVVADPDQLEQLLINLVRNAVEAAQETGGSVEVSWSHNAGFVDLLVRDEGPGISNSANLFVPFFTTKEHGSGIGLALGRQIAEAHGGTISLTNRRDNKGAEARVRIPAKLYDIPSAEERESTLREPN